MFGSKKNKNNTSIDQAPIETSTPMGGSRNQVGKDTKIIGEVECVGNIRMDGTLEGTLICKSKAVIGNTGTLIGKLKCEHADIGGRVQGDITINDTLFIRSSAVVEGNITTKKLVVESGAVMNAKVSMDSNNSKQFGNIDSKTVASGKQAKKAQS